MASRHSFSEKDLPCSVCSGIFKDPVLLSCSHNVCKTCLHQFWNFRESQECPVCKERPTVLSSNSLLKIFSEDFLQERSCQTTTASSEELCSVHSKKLLLFCLEDKEPMCVACQTSEQHENHNFCYIGVATQDHKVQLKTALKPMQEKLSEYEEIKMRSEQASDHIEHQVHHTEKQIRKQFRKLHEFLVDEEATRVAALWKEEEQKRQMMKNETEKMSSAVSSLSDSIGAVEELITEDLSFLQRFKSTVRTYTRVQNTLPEPVMASGPLIHVAKHLSNLKFRIWEKMLGTVQYTPVTLDPNTAHPKLILSEDLTSMDLCHGKQQLPYNPERFYAYPCVLGSEGFDSGTHCWDVDVGDKTHWEVGVITESSHRRGLPSPDWGCWSIEYSEGEYGARCSAERPGIPVHVREKPQRIRVQLNCTAGTVSFSDPLTEMGLHTFAHNCSERLFPFFFSLCKLHPLRVLPSNCNITWELNN